MRLRFQADADFNNSAVIAVSRRWPAIEIRSAQGLIPDAMPDEDILVLAAAHDRVVLTHDISTMPGHFARFIETQESPGVILVKQSLSIATIMEGIYLAWSQWTADDLRNAMFWLPR